MKTTKVTESTVEDWIKPLSCPVIRIDETLPINDNVNFIINQIKIKSEFDYQ